MDLSLGFVRALYVFVLVCCILFYLRRLLWRRRKRQGRRHLGFCPTYTSAGNALQALQVLAQPRAEHVLVEKFDDEADDDDEGDPDHPEKHLHRQLRRIRRGEKVEKLIVLRR